MKQTTQQVVMVRPAHFSYNEETAASNTFQSKPFHPPAESAVREFDDAVNRLVSRGLEVLVIHDPESMTLPDSVFPNNWLSLHHDGTLVLYPMAASSRRKERRADIQELLQAAGFTISSTFDLTSNEQSGHFLEGTGSMVFDHQNNLVYLARSSRSSVKVLDQFCERFQYKPIVFDSIVKSGVPIYHTNVLMAVGNKFAIVCEKAIVGQDIGRVFGQLEIAGKTIINISEKAMHAFGANVLELQAADDSPVLVVSENAMAAYDLPVRKKLEQHFDLLTVKIPTIEKVGGGGIRCMMAENFLPESKVAFQVFKVTQQSDFEKCYQLRWEVLRLPWGQPKGSELDELDGTAPLFAVKKDNTIIGTGRWQEVTPGVVQFRYMATHPECRREGIGKALMFAMEADAKSKGAHKIILQAREPAVPFYQSCGYSITEKTFLLYEEIQHYLMEKKLK